MMIGCLNIPGVADGVAVGGIAIASVSLFLFGVLAIIMVLFENNDKVTDKCWMMAKFPFAGLILGLTTTIFAFGLHIMGF